MSPHVLQQSQPLPFVPRLPSGKRGSIAVSSLRPGDFIGSDRIHDLYCVLQNSAKLRKIEFQGTDSMRCYVEPYEEMNGQIYQYLGKGKKRHWWPMLPKWMRARILPYSRPSK